jgi:hypothetical protein
MINEQSIRKACNDLADLLIKKNRDYGNSVQEQFNEYGLTSILIRLDDKQRRLKTLQNQNPSVTSESRKDTLTDTAGYAILGLLCLEDEPLPDMNYNLSLDKYFKKLEELKSIPHPYFDPDDQH